MSRKRAAVAWGQTGLPRLWQQLLPGGCPGLGLEGCGGSYRKCSLPGCDLPASDLSNDSAVGYIKYYRVEFLKICFLQEKSFLKWWENKRVNLPFQWE